MKTIFFKKKRARDNQMIRINKKVQRGRISGNRQKEGKKNNLKMLRYFSFPISAKKKKK